MACENGYYWTDHATNCFAKHKPGDDEIDAVDELMVEVQAGKHDVARIPFGRDWDPQYVVRCGRFAVLFDYIADPSNSDLSSSDPQCIEITEVRLWEEFE